MPWSLYVSDPNETPEPSPHHHSAKIKLDMWDEMAIQKGEMESVCRRDFVCDVCGQKFRVSYGYLLPEEE